MKRIIGFALAACLIFTLAGCSDGEKSKGTAPPTDSGYNFKTDFQKGFHYGEYSSDLMCESETGYYFLVGSFGGLLYYAEKGSMNTIHLCGKPECAHNSKDCNAFLEAQSIAYYDGRLYYAAISDNPDTSGNSILYSMAPDGTDRGQVQTLHEVDMKNPITTGFSGSAFIIHRGYVYYQDGENIYHNRLNEDKKNAVKISNFAAPDAASKAGGMLFSYGIWKIYADGNYIYYMGDETVSGTYKETLYRYDPQSGENKMVWRVPDEKDVGKYLYSGVRTNGWYIADGYLYYFLSENGLYRYSLEDGKNERFAVIPKDVCFGDATFDNKYIYINNANSNVKVSGEDKSVFVYDYSGNRLGTIAYGKQTDTKYFLDFFIVSRTETQIFFAANQYVDENHISAYPAFFVCDKDSLPDGKIEQVEFATWDIPGN